MWYCGKEHKKGEIQLVYNKKTGLYILKKNKKPIGISIHPPAKEHKIYKKEEP